MILLLSRDLRHLLRMFPWMFVVFPRIWDHMPCVPACCILVYMICSSGLRALKLCIRGGICEKLLDSSVVLDRFAKTFSFGSCEILNEILSK